MTTEKKRGAGVAVPGTSGDTYVDTNRKSASLEHEPGVRQAERKGTAGYIVHGRYLIAKADLIEYTIEHGDEDRPGRFWTGSLER